MHPDLTREVFDSIDPHNIMLCTLSGPSDIFTEDFNEMLMEYSDEGEVLTNTELLYKLTDNGKNFTDFNGNNTDVIYVLGNKLYKLSSLLPFGEI